MNKYIRLLISVGLLTWLAWQTDWRKIGKGFSQLRLELWVLALGLLTLTQIVSSFRWQVLARPLGFNRPTRQMIGFYFIGMYFNLLLPTSVGGDVVRAWYLDGGSGKKLNAFFSVFLDRLCGLWVLLVLACLGVLLSPLPLPGWITGTVWGCALCGLLGTLSLPLMGKYHARATGKLQRILQALQALPSLNFLVWPILLSVVVQVANVFLVWVLGEAIGAPVPASYYWILVPMVSLLTMLPISVGGAGVREVTTALMLAPLGVSEGIGLTLAILWFAVTAAASLLGGLVYLVGRFPRPVLPETPEQEKSKDGTFDRNPDQGRERQFKAAA